MAARVFNLSPDHAEVRRTSRDIRIALTDLLDDPLSEENAARVVELLRNDAVAAREALARISTDAAAQ